MMTRFGEKLRSLRQYHKMTLAELSQLLEYNTHSYISEIESGRKLPTTILVLKISYLFNIPTDELLKDEFSINLHDSIVNREFEQI